VDCLIKKLGIENALGTPKYNPTLTEKEIQDNHRSVWISTKDEELDLPSLYWIPKFDKYPCKQHYVAGSAKCSTKPLSKLLTYILSAVKTGLQRYCDTSYSMGGVNQMRILNNSKDLLKYIQSRSLTSCNNIKIFDFSTVYTTIPHSNLRDRFVSLKRMANVDANAFSKKGQIYALTVFFYLQHIWNVWCTFCCDISSEIPTPRVYGWYHWKHLWMETNQLFDNILASLQHSIKSANYHFKR